MALVSQWQQVQSELTGVPPRAALETLTQILDDATPYLAEAQGQPIMWGMDGHHVEIAAPTMQIMTYERIAQWVDVRPGLGHGPIEQVLDTATLLREAARCDVLILVKFPPGARASYPYDQSIRDQHQILERYVQAEFSLMGAYAIFDTPYLLYVRPRPTSEVTSPVGVIQDPEL